MKLRRRGSHPEDGKAVIKTVTKHGFTEEEVRGFFRDGGCVDDAIRVEVNEEVSEVPIRKGNPRFLVARGVRGSSA
ncbi:hypothetical protein KEM52_001654 [Ascosphaera acerosa]|nr:hypothetical protein KEM52_001654 [Ascosphaera acerosa]